MNVQAIVKRMFHTKPSKIVGVDIGTGSIKMVQIETGSKPVVSCFAVAELPLELINNGFVRNSDAMISFIKGLVAKYDFNARHAVFTVGGRNAFVREIDMPEMPDEEMKQSVAWDSSQYVPYEADTYYVDSAKFGAYTNEGLQPVLLVASPKDVIDSLLEISDALAWHTIGIDIEVLSAYRTLPRQLENFVLLDIGRSYSMLTIFQNGAPVAQRSIPQ